MTRKLADGQPCNGLHEANDAATLIFTRSPQNRKPRRGKAHISTTGARSSSKRQYTRELGDLAAESHHGSRCVRRLRERQESATEHRRIATSICKPAGGGDGPQLTCILLMVSKRSCIDALMVELGAAEMVRRVVSERDGRLQALQRFRGKWISG